MIHNEGPWNRQLPAGIAIGKGKIDECSPVNALLFVWNTIDQSKLSCDMVPGIAQQAKPQLVLVDHEE